jgi:uncharacterized protein with HEPN domain
MTEPADARDLKRVADMLAHAQDALDLIAGLDEAAFRASQVHLRAVLHCLTIVGEAASKTSKPFQQRHPGIPWAVIIGMRNKLVHDYGGVAVAVVWTTATEDLPALVGRLREIVPPG